MAALKQEVVISLAVYQIEVRFQVLVSRFHVPCTRQQHLMSVDVSSLPWRSL